MTLKQSIRAASDERVLQGYFEWEGRSSTLFPLYRREALRRNLLHP